MCNYRPHNLLQLAQHIDGRIFVAAHTPNGVVWDRLPLVDGVEPMKNPPIDAQVLPVSRPDWAIDFYSAPVWQIACQQYDSIGS